MSFSVPELILLAVAALLFGALVFLLARLVAISRAQAELSVRVNELLEAKHLSMLKDLNDGLNSLGDRLGATVSESSERLRGGVEQQLRQTREALVALQLSQSQDMAANREQLLATVSETHKHVLENLAANREQLLGTVAEIRSHLLESLSGQREQLLATVGEVRTELLQSMSGQREQLLGTVSEMRTEVINNMAGQREQLLGTVGEMRTEVVQSMASQREQLLTTVGELRSDIRDKALTLLAEQGRTQSETLQDSVRSLGLQLTASVEALTRTADARLGEIQGKVSERLEEGFRKTNETFVSVMARLATIDEAQRKIDGLTTNVVSLQELLGDKRSRGAFGEVQLEALVRNILPPSAYEFQRSLSNGTRADCVLLLPEPTGTVAVDSKFPLENYHRMFDPDLPEGDRLLARKQFRADIRRHVDDIASRYIVPGETSEAAVMFVPAEAVFAEIHAYHAEVVDHAMQRRVWIVSPTTMMAVLNTARAVIKDVETRRQVHVIKDELAKLGKDFGRFDERMRKLADHIRRAHEDAEQVRISSDKITRRFHQIEKVELDQPADLQRLERADLEAETPEPESQEGLAS
jgi:DNA recombination protein RmuC